MTLLQVVTWPLYNRQERRLRALWRLLVLLILLALMVKGVVTVDQYLEPGIESLLGANGTSKLFELIVFVIPILIVAKWIDRRRLQQLGLRCDARWWLECAFGALLGGLAITLVLVVELALGWASASVVWLSVEPAVPFWQAMSQTVFLFILVSVEEELFSRGYLLRNLAEACYLRRIGPLAAALAGTIISSLIFSVLHAGNDHVSTLALVNVGLAGVLLSAAYLLTGQLAIPIGLHLTWNLCQAAYGFPVSGRTLPVMVVVTTTDGPPLWVGGGFGPEGGLLSTVAMALCLAAIVGWVRFRHGGIELQTSMAIYRGPHQTEAAVPAIVDDRWVEVMRAQPPAFELNRGEPSSPSS